MSILIDKRTRLLIQGITGRDGRFHADLMLKYNTDVVAGTSPGKGGTHYLDIPIFNTVLDAVEETQANTSIIFVPAPFAYDAILEAVDGGIELIVCITEGIPVQDVIKASEYAKSKNVLFVGPNSPGIISPGKSLVGIFPSQFFKSGNIGIVSRSGTLTYEVVNYLTKARLGQSTAIGIGGDPIIGLGFIDVLRLFQRDARTKAIVLIGEIGGVEEESAANYIKGFVGKPVVAFIAGKSAPADKQMGHAGAIITKGEGTAIEKIESLRLAGVTIAESPSDIPSLIKGLL